MALTNVTGYEVIEKAKSYIGKYPKHCNKFTKHYAGRYGVSKSGKIKAGYCTIFAGYVLDHIGGGELIPKEELGKDWWNTQKLCAYYKKHNGKGKKCISFVTDPAQAKAGAIAFKKVGSTSKKTTGHTSIFIKYEDGDVWTIDGNVGGGVKIRKKKSSWYVGFANLNYASKPKTKYNKACFPMKNLRITATPTSTDAHRRCNLDYPVDLAGADSSRDWLWNRLGSELVVLRRYTSASHGLWLRTKNKVLIPHKGAVPVYLYMLIEHQDLSEMKPVNTSYPVNGKVVREGNNGLSSGYHLHVSFGMSSKKITYKTIGSGWKRAPKGGWSLYHPDITPIKIEQAVYIDSKFTKVIDTKGIKFKTI